MGGHRTLLHVRQALINGRVLAAAVIRPKVSGFPLLRLRQIESISGRICGCYAPAVPRVSTAGQQHRSYQVYFHRPRNIGTVSTLRLNRIYVAFG